MILSVEWGRKSSLRKIQGVTPGFYRLHCLKARGHHFRPPERGRMQMVGTPRRFGTPTRLSPIEGEGN
jgi:hypothetical protein